MMNSKDWAGLVFEIHGSKTGLLEGAFNTWYQGKSTVAEGTEAQDNFGWGLAAAPVNWHYLYLPYMNR